MGYQSEDGRLSMVLSEALGVAQAQLRAVEGTLDLRRTAALKHVIRHLENAKRDAKLAYNDKPIPDQPVAVNCPGWGKAPECEMRCIRRPECAAVYGNEHAVDGVEARPGRDPIVESKIFADGRAIDW